eukprot:1349260-Amphidinium_carterae.1
MFFCVSLVFFTPPLEGSDCDCHPSPSVTMTSLVCLVPSLLTRSLEPDRSQTHKYPPFPLADWPQPMP